jgi:hypothetical protein
MADPRCNGYPCVLYHPTKAPKGQTFASEDEVKILGPKWVNSKKQLPKSPIFPAWVFSPVVWTKEHVLPKLIVGLILLIATALGKVYLLPHLVKELPQQSQSNK